MSANPETSVPSGRKKLTTGKERNAAARGHESHNPSRPEDTKENGKVALGDVTEARVAQTGPRGREFTYVDIGSIELNTKRIVDPKILPLSKAPSRAKQVLKRGDVLVSMTRPNRNAVALVPADLDNAIGSTGFHVLRANGVEPEFLFYAVQTNEFIDALCEKVQGALYPAVRPRDISSFKTFLPSSLTDQRRIVGEIEKQFTRLEAGVAALRRMQANLKRYRAAVLKAACEGRLVPTEAELAKTGNRKANFETGEALLARILNERRKNWRGRGQYKDPVTPHASNLPKLPDGWCWAGTEQLTAGIDNAITIGPFGSNLMVKDYRESGVSLIFVREIRSENFRRADSRYVSPQKAAELTTHKVRGGDVVITKMGEPPGDTAIYPQELPDAIATSDCIKLTPNLKGTTAAFLKYIIRGQPVKIQIQHVTRGVAQKKMSLARFRTVAVPLPPLDEQARIVAEVERRLSVVEELEAAVSANLQRAARLRQSILQKAFTGALV